jgi:putative DNA primase/helicase
MSKIQFFNDNNLCVIPVHPLSKKPKPNDWQNRRSEDNDPNEYSEDSNCGVVLGDASAGLVDIDLDCDLARRLAPYLLPPTGWVFGRASAPRSHYLYRVNGDSGRGRKFDVGRKKFAEYRANGQMTVFPPSIHESGEPIEFEVSGEIGTSTQARLHESLLLMAICAVVIPHYVKGKRNDIVLALSGTLLSRSRSEQEVRQLVEALCDISGDLEKSSRLEAVRTTSARNSNDQPFTQSRHLAGLIGEDAMDELRIYLAIEKVDPPASTITSTSGLLASDDQNDTGVAQLFAGHVKDRILYDDQTRSFYCYNDGIWVPDEGALEVSGRLDEFVQETVASLRNHHGVSHDQCLSQGRFLLRYRNRTPAQNAIAQSRTFLRAEPGQLDGRDDLIAVRNGLLNLADRTFKPLCPDDYVTRRLAVAYDPRARCPIFLKVLSDSFCGDKDLIAYVKGILGYWLTGLTNRQELYILLGSVANGKSTILNAISHVLGSYAGTLMSETIFEGGGSGHNADLASMRGLRLAVVHEAESKFRLNSARLKQITGQDTIKVRPLYKDPFDFLPKFKVAIICNKKPDLDAYDDALKRRLKLIPFEHVVPANERDPLLGEKLKAEASGILNFIVEGAQMFFRGEIREPVAVKRATETYIAGQDSVRAFLQDCSVRSPGAMVGKGVLYDTYARYCEDEILAVVSKGQFGAILKSMNYTDTRSGDERQWKGVRLLQSNEAPDLHFPQVGLEAAMRRVG